MRRLAAPWHWLVRAWKTPGEERLALSQALKAALAAMLAWLVSTTLLGLPQPFLAPYAALFAVEYTVTGTLRSAMHQIASTISAVLLAALIELLLPWRTLGIGVAVLVGLLVGRSRVYGDSGQWVALTALLILAWGSAGDRMLLIDRLIETALGLGIGTAVNVLVFPPFYARPARRSAEHAAERFAGLLGDMVAELRREEPTAKTGDWPAQAREAGELAREAERAVRYSRQSRRLNARRTSVTRYGPTERQRKLLASLRAGWPQLHQIAEVLRTTTDQDTPFSYPELSARQRLAEVLDGFATMVRLRSEPEPYDGEFTRAQQRCEELLARLTDQLDEGAPHGLAAMVLPARRLLAELAKH